MAEFTANAVQTVQPGEAIIFTENPVPCTRGFINWRGETGNFSLSGWCPPSSGCCCCVTESADYLVDFGANIAIPTGEDVGAISVAINIDGATIPASTMIVTPAAVEQYFNVSRAINAQVWRGCCQTVTVRNTSTIPILVQNANIILTRPDLILSK